MMLEGRNGIVVHNVQVALVQRDTKIDRQRDTSIVGLIVLWLTSDFSRRA
jgi:hypothetical protein